MTNRQMLSLLKICGVIIAVSVGMWAYGWVRGGHRHWVSAAAFNADGTLLVTAAGEDHLAEIILWDVPKSRKIVRQNLKIGRPKWIRFSEPNRQVVLSCDVVGKNWDDYKPNEITVFDLERRAKIDSFAEPGLLGDTLALEQTSQLVVYGRQSIELREVAGDKRTTLMSDRDADVNRVGISSDERYLAAGCDGVARIWDLQTKTELPALDAQGIELGTIAIAAGGNFVAAARYEFTATAETFPVFFWNRPQGASEVSIVQFEQPVTTLQFLPGAAPRLLVVSGKDHLDCRIAIYDPTGRQFEELYAGNAAVTALDVTHDGTQLVWVDSRHRGELWKLDGDKPIRLWQKTLGELRSIQFSPDAQLLAGYGWGPDISLYRASAGQVVTRLQGYQPSTVPLQLLYFLPLLLVMAVVEWFRRRGVKRRKASMLVAAQQLGWQHTSGALPAGIPEFHFFAKRGGGNFEHVLLGAGENYDTLLAVYSWVQGSGDSKTPMEQLCVIFPHVDHSLPDVFVRPESFADKLAEYIGFSDVDLNDSQIQELFSARYLLRTKVPEQMPALINEPLAEFLCEHEGWNIELVDGSVLMWWQVVKSFTTSRFHVSDSSDILAFAEESRKILELLVPAIARGRR